MPRTSILRIAISLAFATSSSAFAQAQPAAPPPGAQPMNPPKFGIAIPFEVTNMIPPDVTVDVGCTVFDSALKPPAGMTGPAPVGGGRGQFKVMKGAAKGTTIIGIQPMMDPAKKVPVGNLDAKGLTTKCYLIQATPTGGPAIPALRLARNPQLSLTEINGKLPDVPRPQVLTASQTLKLVGPTLAPPPGAPAAAGVATVDFLVKVKSSGLPTGTKGVEVVCEVRGASGPLTGGKNLVRLDPESPGGEGIVNVRLVEPAHRDLLATGKASYGCHFSGVLDAVGLKPINTLQRASGSVFETAGPLAAPPAAGAPRAAPVTVPMALILVPKPKSPFGG